MVRAIEGHSPLGERPTEGQSRELVTVARQDPARAAEVWKEVNEEASETGHGVTAARVRHRNITDTSHQTCHTVTRGSGLPPP